MEQDRHQPSQPPQPADSENSQVVMEPIKDLGLPQKPRRNGSLSAKRRRRKRHAQTE